MLNIKHEIDDAALTLEIDNIYNGKMFTYSVSANETESIRADLIRLRETMNGSIVSPWTEEILHPLHVSQINPHLQIYCVGQKVSVTAFKFRPYISLDNTSYNWTFNSFGVEIHGLDIFVRNALFRESEDESTIFVSIDMFKEVFDQIEDSAETTVIVGVLSSETEGILTLILMCTSILCLLLTLITYSVLPALRSQPGINNMILSVFLIIAYVSFLFISSKPGSDVGCQLLGGAIHFSWLLVLLWMNICSFHMFRVFGSLNKQHPSAGSKCTTGSYLLYCFLCASSIVAINVGVTYYTSDGGSYGYGSSKTGVCNIYDPALILFVITVPCILIATVNLIMFFIVIFRMHRMTDVKRHVRNDRNYFLIHIRLSTITGMTWIMALPMVLTNLVVFSYIYIVLACSQGIYLMIAFVCNKRVFKLLADKISRKTAVRNTTYASNITDKISDSHNGKTVTSNTRKT